MHAACIAGLGAAIKRFGDAEGFDITDYLVGVDEVEADGGVRKRLSLLHVNNVGCGRQEAACLALERKVLGIEMRGGKRGRREEAANCEFVDDAKIHVFSTPLVGSGLPP